MTKHPARLALLTTALLCSAVPAATQAQSTATTAAKAAAAAEARLKKLEAEVSALQRSVFPGGDGKFFTPEVSKTGTATAATSGTVPATTPVTDLLSRMDGVETQLARLTAQNEENGNRIAQLEAKLAAMGSASAAPAAVTAPATTAPATTAPAATTTGGPANLVPAATTTTAPTPAPVAAAPKPAAITPAPAKPAVAPAATSAKPAAPSAQRLAAVKKVEKPATDDPGDDEYSYGYRLWEAKFYPEAEQQLKIFLDKYPKHERVSYARNLLGRALLDEGKPREAAQWFLQNYQANKKGARAPDSLLFLAESMGQLKDTNRACIALAEFGDSYKAEATGRLKAQYDATRSKLKCD